MTSPANEISPMSGNEVENLIGRRMNKLVGNVKTKDGLPVTGPSGLTMGITTIVATTTKYRPATMYGNQ